MGEQWDEIFKAGSYPQGVFTEADLDKSVEIYSPSVHEAPAVVGHPETDKPAYGWVSKLKREGGSLLALYSQLDPKFQETVKSGAYKKRSAAFYKTPAGWYLRHVGFLGAAPPQVKGLRDVKFAEGEDKKEFVTIEFDEEELRLKQAMAGSTGTAGGQHPPAAPNTESNKEANDMAQEIDDLKAQVEALGKQLQEAKAASETIAREKAEFAEKAAKLESGLRQKEIEARLDKLSQEGKVTPAERKTGLAAFLSRLDSAVEVEFAEGSKQTAAEFVFKLLENRPPMVEFGESCKGGKAAGPASQDPKEIAKKAKAYHAEQAKNGNHISFTEAVAAVAKK